MVYGLELTVKACVRAGESVFIAIVAVDVEPIDPVHALEFLEAIQRHLGCAGDKLK